MERSKWDARASARALLTLQCLAICSRAFAAYCRPLAWAEVLCSYHQDSRSSSLSHLYLTPTLHPLVKHLRWELSYALTRMTPLALAAFSNLSTLALEPNESMDPLAVPKLVSDTFVHLPCLRCLKLKYFWTFEDPNFRLEVSAPGVRELLPGLHWTEWEGSDTSFSRLETLRCTFKLWNDKLLPLDGGGLLEMRDLYLIAVKPTEEAPHFATEVVPNLKNVLSMKVRVVDMVQGA